MAKQINKTRIAAAVSAAVVGAGLSAPAGAVVVVGGNDGWEVSFDGNVNAFYTIGDMDAGFVTESVDKDTTRIHSGFLPAFFSFNVKSPTVNGMTGTARISFAPVIQTGGAKTQFNALANGAGSRGNLDGISGATIDTREVLANLSGAFGEISFGRTLSLFGRNAILNDMTLFGVGFAPGADHFGSVTFGRVGHGYTYPDFAARFQYTSPNVNGFQVALGMYDPSVIPGVSTIGNVVGGTQIGGLLDETDTPRFEGEISYSTTWSGGTFKAWVDGLWQEIDSSCQGVTAAGVVCDGITSSAWGAGAKLGWNAFEFVGYYHDNEGLGLTAQFTGFGVGTDAAGNLDERDGDGYYLQGTYTFGGKTKVGVSYGEGNMDSIDPGSLIVAGSATSIERSMWTVGVYHDVSSWLRLIAEYNHAKLDIGGSASDPEADTFSVGGFLFW